MKDITGSVQFAPEIATSLLNGIWKQPRSILFQGKNAAMSDGMDLLRQTYFSSGGDIFIFGMAPVLWFCLLFVAKINRLQIIKSLLFILMYGHFLGYTVYCLTRKFWIYNIKSCFIEPIYLFLLQISFLLWVIIFIWNIIEFIILICKKTRFEKTRELRTDFICRTFLQILLLSGIALAFLYRICYAWIT